jgi:hypothetical protein
MECQKLEQRTLKPKVEVREQHRAMLLSAIESRTPIVLLRLYQDVLPKCTQESTNAAALNNWAHEHHLTPERCGPELAEWFAECAKTTIQHWLSVKRMSSFPHSKTGAKQSLKWFVPKSLPDVDLGAQEECIQIQIEVKWDRTCENKPTVNRRVLAEYNKQLAAEHARIERSLPPRFSRSAVKARWHFEALTLHLIKNFSHLQVKMELEGNPPAGTRTVFAQSTVSYAIKTAAEAVGLASPRGAKTGSNPSPPCDLPITQPHKNPCP